MKPVLLFLALAASVGQTVPVPNALPAPPALPAPTAAATSPTPADDSMVPTAGFQASRYESLWTKSPFAVATSEEATETSPDYMLVGIANIDGISFASLIDRQSQEHFLISSDQETRGLKLSSITKSHDGSDTFAVVQKDGQTITLKLEVPPAGAVAENAPPGAQQVMAPQISMPGAIPTFGGGGANRPFARFHRPPIHLPPQPGQQVQQPVQVHPTAPPPPPPAQ
jgi:hypothetical protein